MSMELVLPARSRPERGEPLASPRGARKWLDGIRQGSDREAAREFIEGLQRFNRIELRTGTRRGIAELMRPTARYLLERVSQRIAQKLPLDESSRRNFHTLLLLLREMGLAYDICAADLDSARRPSGRVLSLVTERALFCRGEVMLRSAPVHSPLPQNFWHDSNVLFRLAEAKGCADRPVRNEELTGRGRQTPRDMYKRLVLLALAPTDGLRRGQVERLFQGAETWAPLAQMLTRHPRESSNTLFRIDLDRPEGPRSASTESETTPGLRWIEFAPVLAAVQRLLPHAPSEGSVLNEGEVDAATLQALIASWTVHSGRAGERLARGELVDAEVSLHSIHARLAAEAAPAGSAGSGGRGQRPTASAMALQTIESSARRWQQLDDENDPVLRTSAIGTRPAQTRTQAAEAPRQWQLIDSGGGGCRLRWQGSGATSAVVGDLVAVRGDIGDTRGRGAWMLGTIRRVRMIDDERFDAGVQILGRKPAAITMRLARTNPNRKRDKRAGAGVHPALMLPADRAGSTPATVFVAPNTFREGDLVELDMAGRSQRARLAPAREHSAVFARFRLEKAPPRGRTAG